MLGGTESHGRAWSDAKGDSETILCWEAQFVTGRGCVSGQGRKQLRTAWHLRNVVRKAGL